MRGILFHERHAREVADTLVRHGFTATVSRTGSPEEGDRDRPWAVETDAPQLTLEILVDRYDGWLDTD